MNIFKKEVDLGQGCTAVLFLRPPTYDERKAFERVQFVNLPLLVDEKGQPLEDVQMDIKVKAIQSMEAAAYEAGKSIICAISCDSFPEWVEHVKLTGEYDELEIFKTYYSQIVVVIAQEVFGIGAGKAAASVEMKKAAAEYVSEVNLEQEQTKN